MPEANRKSVPILLRVLPEEKATFQEAAELAGLNLTTWLRTRLRVAVTQELKKAGVDIRLVKKRKRP
jgi:hypothetical protein